MPKAVSDAPARYRAFRSALRRTANAELAFVQSGVNRSWAYWRRNPEPGEADAILPLVQGMTAEVALQTLRLHKSAQPWRTGPRPSDPEVARASILRQVDVVLRGDAAGARRRATYRAATRRAPDAER